MGNDFGNSCQFNALIIFFYSTWQLTVFERKKTYNDVWPLHRLETKSELSNRLKLIFLTYGSLFVLSLLYLVFFLTLFLMELILNVICGGFAALYQFTQQNLPACKPVLTPAAVSSLIILEYFMVSCSKKCAC